MKEYPNPTRKDRRVVQVNITGRPHIREAVKARIRPPESLITGAARLLEDAKKHVGEEIKITKSPPQSNMEVRSDTLEDMRALAAQQLGLPEEKITNILALEVATRLAEKERG